MIAASATHYLANFPNNKTQKVNRSLISNKEPLVRREAVRNFIPTDIEDLKSTLLPLLDDPTLMVRLEATSKLSVLRASDLDSLTAFKLKNAIDEYIATTEYSADFAASRHNLGNLYSNLGETQKAIKNYKEAIKIDKQFFPASINLAMLYNSIGKNDEAEILLLEVIRNNPDMGDIYYSLGLLQAEMGNYDKSIMSLQKAVEFLPGRSRIWFNLYTLYEFQNKITEAQTALENCLKLEPRNLEFLYAKIEFLLKRKREKEAIEVAKEILEYYPDLQDKKDLENFIKMNR